MSKSTAATKAGKPTITTLRASAQPLDGKHHFTSGDADVPAHVAPFKPFEWTDSGDAPRPTAGEAFMLRDLINNTINIVTGAVLCLRIVEQCASVGDFSPQTVELEDGTLLEQPDAPYLDVVDSAALQSMVCSMLTLLANDAHNKAGLLRS